MTAAAAISREIRGRALVSVISSLAAALFGISGIIAIWLSVENHTATPLGLAAKIAITAVELMGMTAIAVLQFTAIARLRIKRQELTS